MPQLSRFAANLSMMFGELPFLQRFAAAAAAGFEAVEFLFPYEHPAEVVYAAAKGAGVRTVLFNLPAGDWAAGERGIAALPDRAAEFTASVAQALEYAQVLNVSRLHLMAGIAAADDLASWSRYKEAIHEAAMAAAPLGIEILLEPLNGRDVPGYLLNDFDLAADLIAELNLPNLRLQFDIYHRQILHGDVIKSLKKLLPITGHIQTASVPGRNEPNSGELNDTAIFNTLDQLGYRGYIGCEYRPLGETTRGLGWLRPYHPTFTAGE